MVQVTTQNNTLDLYMSGMAISKDQETILQDAGRTTPLVFGTVMAKIAATGKWVPLINVALTTGAGVARGIFVGADITAAALVAGDVIDVPIVVGGDSLVVDENLITLENSLTLATVVETGTVQARTIEDDLINVGIFAGESISITGQQS